MRKRDEESFSRFYEQTVTSFNAIAYSLTLNHHDADDLLADSYAAVLAHWPRISRNGDPTGYLRRTVTNKFINSRGVGAHRYERPVLAVPENETLDELDWVVSHDRVHEVLASLTNRERLVVVSRVLVGLSVAEVAESMSCSPSNIVKTTRRARDRMRATVEAWEEL